VPHATPRTIEVSVDGPVATITLNRPERLNALTKEVLGELTAALDAYAADEGVRVVVWRGAGRAFSSGFDMAEGDEDSTHTAMEWRSHLGPAAAFARKLWSYDKPTIAAVHGYCLGGACGLAMLCDLTVASDDCLFGEPEIRFGVASANVVMPWIVPIKIAKELLYTGAMINARRAYEVGMVNAVVPRAELDAEARRRALVLSRISPEAVHLMKQAVNHAYESMGMPQSLAHAFNLVAVLDASDSAEKREFRDIAAASGVKAALTWRRKQFAELEPNG
jgi:enoyl-CoA hydratase/carnithine racemase